MPICQKVKLNNFFMNEVNMQREFVNSLVCNPIRDAAKPNRAWHTVGADSLLVPFMNLEACFYTHKERKELKRTHTDQGEAL